MHRPRGRRKWRPSATRAWTAPIVVLLLVSLLAITIGNVLFPARARAQADVRTHAEHRADPASNSDRARGALHPVLIKRPEGPPRLSLDERDALGRPVTVACSTCHTIREPNPDNRSTAQLDEFHQGLTVAHGSLTCLSCHNRDNYDTLRLADGASLAYEEVMMLCAQCHGPQWRDYQRGAHGGMAGHWDLTRGPRTRNNCIDCHDPHVPAFPRMIPTFKPRDRRPVAGHAASTNAVSNPEQDASAHE